MKHTRRALWALLALSWSISASLAAPIDHDMPVPEPEFHNFGCDQPYARRDGIIDAAREGLDEMLCEANYWLDGLFSSQGDLNAARSSYGRLAVANSFSEREGWDLRLRLRVTIRLPTWKERLTAFVGREPNADFTRGRSQGLALREEFPSLADEDQWLAGLGYAFPGKDRFSSNFRIGARRFNDPEIFVRNRVQWNAYSDFENLVNLRLIPFWTNEDEFGLTLGLDLARALGAHTLLRWDTVGTQSASTIEVDWRSAVLLYRSLSAAVGIAGELYAAGDTGQREQTREYGARAIYRRPLIPDKLNLQLSLGESWYQNPDALSRRRAYFNGNIILELPFGY